MRALFIIPLVLMSLVSFPSWSGVADGKSIICRCINCTMTIEEQGWEFVNGKVLLVFPDTYEDQVIIKKESIGDYWSNEDRIVWTTRSLNRSTLIITDTYYRPPAVWRCEIFQSLSEFNKQWETTRERLQSEYNLKLKKNQI